MKENKKVSGGTFEFPKVRVRAEFRTLGKKKACNAEGQSWVLPPHHNKPGLLSLIQVFISSIFIYGHLPRGGTAFSYPEIRSGAGGAILTAVSQRIKIGKETSRSRVLVCPLHNLQWRYCTAAWLRTNGIKCKFRIRICFLVHEKENTKPSAEKTRKTKFVFDKFFTLLS